MEQALDVHRFHFAFTVTFHYIFPQLTMGLEASRHNLVELLEQKKTKNCQNPGRSQ